MKGSSHGEIPYGNVRSAYPVVCFNDLAPEPSHPESAQARWPTVVLVAFEEAFEAAAQGVLLLQHETIDIAQRNVNASFCLLRKLAGAKNLGEIFDLQAAYWRNQFGALVGQAQELRALSTKVAGDMVEPIEAHAKNTIDHAHGDLTPLIQ